MTDLFSQLVSTTAGAFVLLAIAAFLEVFGDACFQSAMYQSTGTRRALWFIAGSLVLVFYSLFVNTPKWDFGKLLGVYVVLFFVVAQIVARLSLPAVANAARLCRRRVDRSGRRGHDLLERLRARSNHSSVCNESCSLRHRDNRAW